MSNKTKYQPVVGQLVRTEYGIGVITKDYAGQIVYTLLYDPEQDWFGVPDNANFLTPSEVLEWMLQNGWKKQLSDVFNNVFYDYLSGKDRVFTFNPNSNNHSYPAFNHYGKASTNDVKRIHAAQSIAITHYEYYLRALEGEELNKEK